MNPFYFILPFLGFSIIAQPFNEQLFTKIEGEWNVIGSTNITNKHCYFINITNENDKVLWKEDYQLDDKTHFNQEIITSKDFRSFHSKNITYNILFNSYFKDFMVIQRNDEILVLSKSHEFTYDEYFYLGASLPLITNEKINFINNEFSFC